MPFIFAFVHVLPLSLGVGVVGGVLPLSLCLSAKSVEVVFSNCSVAFWANNVQNSVFVSVKVGFSILEITCLFWSYGLCW